MPPEVSPNTSTTTKRVALVIGSGSVKCAASLGLLNVLAREGIGIDLVVGCSGGAMYAAATAMGFSTEEATNKTYDLFTREATSQRNRKSLLRIVFPRWFGFNERFGMRDDRPVLKQVYAAFGESTFENTNIPLFITATDFWSGEQVVLSKGRLVDAIRASIAIPFVFEPWEIDGRLLVDGFLSDPLPVNVAMREGADVIVAMGFESPMQKRVSSPTRFAFQFSSMMTNNLLKARFAFHNMSHHSEVIPIIPDFKRRISLFATEEIPYIIEEGERAAEAHLPFIRQLLSTKSTPDPV